MLSAVLFDLDGTLLDIDVDVFLKRYFGLLGPMLAEITGRDVHEALAAVIAGTEAMASSHPAHTNEAVFSAKFHELTGVDITSSQPAEAVSHFYAEVFPQLGDSHGARAGAIEALRAARSAGLKTVLATNPIFPRIAIDERARWAGVDTASFDMVTSYENMIACKPDPAYFLQIAETIGVEPGECLMVGDDPLMDMGAAVAGMRTFLVGEACPEADWCADFADFERVLTDLLPADG